MKNILKVISVLSIVSAILIPAGCSLQSASGGSDSSKSFRVTDTFYAASAVTIEAESMSKSGYSNESNANASGGQVIKLSSTSGSVTKSFSGVTAAYDIAVKYIDQTGGAATFTLTIGGMVIATWTGDQATTSDLFLTKTFTNISVANGAQIKLSGIKNGTELAKYDVVVFTPVGAASSVSSSSTTTSSSSSSTTSSSSSSSTTTSSSKSSTSSSSSSSISSSSVATSSSVSTSTGIIGFGQSVTGGTGGTVVNVTTADEFSKALRLTGPTIIQITGHLVSGYPRCYTDKTIIGIGSGAWLDGGVYLDSKASNVIIKNLKITSNSSSEDGITIKGGQNVWVDHCTFVDCGDGSLDISAGANNITVSWCKFIYTTNHEHNFVNLIGSSDSDSGEYKVTFHHNWWSTLCIERLPSVRFGHVHLFNNYYNVPGNNYCIRTRLNAELLVENNYFENVQNPWEQYLTSAGGTPGKLKATGNTFTNCTWYADAAADKEGNQRVNIPGTDSVFTPSYNYTLEDANSAKTSVMNGAGSLGSGY